jgi:hypothetical protein
MWRDYWVSQRDRRRCCVGRMLRSELGSGGAWHAYRDNRPRGITSVSFMLQRQGQILKHGDERLYGEFRILAGFHLLQDK